MQTKVVKIDPFQIDENEMKEAAELIRKGELVAFQQRPYMVWVQMRCIRKHQKRYMRQRDGHQTIP